MYLRHLCLTAAAIVFIVGCANDQPVEVNITTKSYTEEYPVDVIEKPSTANFEELETNIDIPQIVVNETQNVAQGDPEETNLTTDDIEPESPTEDERIIAELNVVEALVKEETKTEKVEPKNKDSFDLSLSSDSYTLQVAALHTLDDLNQFLGTLPNSYAKWINEKEVNGTKWYAVLIGEFESFAVATEEISNLPETLQNAQPFVRSVNAIMTSGYPEIKSVKKITN
jgi:DamX protein